MRIAYIAAGAAGMYCGSCLRDNALAAALQQQGHDVALIPTYTPLRTDDVSVSIDRIFYNGIGVYLQQKSSLFRKGSRFFDRMLNSRRVINMLARTDSSTNARDLGALTVSVLRGEDGNQRRELYKLVEWLRDDYKPELVQITNSMLAGMIREIKSALNVPVLCAMQGEDIFLDELIEPYKTEAMTLLKERINDADGLIATSEYYADYMAGYLDTPRERIHAVPIGINTDGHGQQPRTAGDGPFVIGYLARICPEKGLHLLVDAFLKLVEDLGTDKVRLRIAGYLSQRDHDYYESIKKHVRDQGLSANVDFIGEVDRQEKIAFLSSLHLLSVPTVYVEPKGLFALEAMANGTPIVQPNHGSFPEIIKATGGGILCEPNSPEDLARAIRSLVDQPDKRKELGEIGKVSVHENFTNFHMANSTLDVYNAYL